MSARSSMVDHQGGEAAAAELTAPLLETKEAAAYVDGCPGCALDRRKAANPGIPYASFIYVWIVTLCTEYS
ncbi:hypothetical protein U9M48_005391 [Paspalum notatum var. saurae]|uniref:Uncharacterized protein n=1 Tax=Paspalum notatum var. saurae TaxID=547442 RepID=A0AAQ3PS56_PASNO